MNTKEFISKSKELFPNKNWNYEITEYINLETPTSIFCNEKNEFEEEYGIFTQLPYSHLGGHACSHGGKYELDYWLKKANFVNENKFEFKITEYVNQHQRIECICHKKDKNGNEHGSFVRTAKQIIAKTYCPKCLMEEKRLKKQKEIIEKLNKIHNNAYDYSLIDYTTIDAYYDIICPKHGIFKCQLSNHLYLKTKCPKCAAENVSQKNKSTYEDFIKKAKKVHGDKYDYSLVNFDEVKNVESVIEIICPIHGKFKKTIHTHLSGQGCKECSNIDRKIKTRKGRDGWIKDFIEKHGCKYNYDLVGEDINYYSEIEIICPIHGKFKQCVGSHANGQGCQTCNESHLEREVRLFLINNNIEYEPQKRFDWLGRQSLDFYLPKYNLAIECQGSQHYIEYGLYSGNDRINEIRERDEKKRKLCNDNGINLVYYQDKRFNKYLDGMPNEILNNIDELLKFLYSIK